MVGMIEKSTGKQFRESHFCQIMTLVPDFFIHKWQMRKGKMELIIEVPENIEEIVAKYDPEGVQTYQVSESAYPHPLPQELIHERIQIMKERVYMMTYKCY